MDEGKQFKAALSRAPVVLFAQDRALRYTWAHNAPFDIEGGLLGRMDAEVFPPATAALLTAIKERVLRAGAGERQQVRVELPGGARHYDLSVEPQRDAGGAIVGLTGVALDITDRVRAEQELRETSRRLHAANATFSHLVQNSPFGVYAVDADFRLVQVSAGAQKVFANVRPLLGRDFAEVLRIVWPEPFATEAIALFRHTLQTGEPYHAPSTVERRADIGEVESYDWKVERITLPDGRLGVVCHFYDLSERQRYEAALKEADRRKDEFLGMLAHELRNPLSAIANAVHLLGAPGGPEANAEWSRDVIARQVAHLTRMVDDLLDVSRVSQSLLTMKKETMPVSVPVSLALDITRAQFEGRRQDLVVDLPEETIGVECDGARLAQAVANLLHNASKFTPEGGRITLAVRREDGRMVLRVRDTGAGMSSELLPHIFDVFVQGDQSLDRREGGLGLGLTISRRLVELQGGTLDASSDGPGRGSEFVLRLPAVASVAPARPAPAAAPPAPSRRILLVDDNEDAVEGLQRILAARGHEVAVASDGPAALAEAVRFRPEMVVLDIGLPEMDGYEVARRMRATAGLEDALLIALTGYGQREDLERARAAGFDHHLVKPVLPETLLALVGVGRASSRPSAPAKGAGVTARHAGPGS